MQTQRRRDYAEEMLGTQQSENVNMYIKRMYLLHVSNYQYSNRNNFISWHARVCTRSACVSADFSELTRRVFFLQPLFTVVDQLHGQRLKS